MLGLVMALMAMFAAPPPRVPQPPQYHFIAESASVDVSSTADTDVMEAAARRFEDRRYAEDGTTFGTLEAQNSTFIDNANILPQGNDPAMGQGVGVRRNQRRDPRANSRQTVNNAGGTSNIADRRGAIGTLEGGTTVNPTNNSTRGIINTADLNYEGRRSELNTKYARMFELRRNMIENAVRLAEEMDEYQSLKQGYNEEMRTLIGGWVDSQSGTPSDSIQLLNNTANQSNSALRNQNNAAVRNNPAGTINNGVNQSNMARTDINNSAVRNNPAGTINNGVNQSNMARTDINNSAVRNNPVGTINNANNAVIRNGSTANQNNTAINHAATYEIAD